MTKPGNSGTQYEVSFYFPSETSQPERGTTQKIGLRKLTKTTYNIISYFLGTLKVSLFSVSTSISFGFKKPKRLKKKGKL